MPAVGRARFPIGAIVRHRILGYRGRVCDVDAICDAEIAGLAAAGEAGPPARPWYHVLVDGADLLTYVAEDQLEDLGRAAGLPGIDGFAPDPAHRPAGLRRLN